MNNLDEALYECIRKYGIYDVNIEMKQHLLAIKYIQELFRKKDFHEIAIWGAGDNTERLLHCLNAETVYSSLIRIPNPFGSNKRMSASSQLERTWLANEMMNDSS